MEINRNKTIGILFIIILALWALLILGDYFNKHPFYFLSVEYFSFPKLGIATIGLGSLAYFLSKARFLQPYSRFYVNGLGVFLLFLVLVTIILLSFSKYSETGATMEGYLYFFLKILKSGMACLIVTLSGLSLGHLARRRGEGNLLNIGLGFILITGFMFFLGLFNLLNPYFILPLLLLPVMLQYKLTGKFLYDLLIKPFDNTSLNAFSFLCGFLIIFYLTINFISIQAPFPSGFDSRNHYVNISQLIMQQEGLIFGFPPFNWSLFMSLGFLFQDTAEIVMSLSFLGYILSLFVGFRIMVQHFNISRGFALLTLLIITVTPAIANQLYVELKTDYGLLFFQLLSIDLLMRMIKSNTYRHFVEGRENTTLNGSYMDLFWQFALLGILLGYGLGIKMINTFLIFAIIVLLFWIVQSGILLTAVVCLVLAVFAIFGLDDVSGLRQYHLSIDIVKWILLLLGVILFGYSIFRYKKKILKICILASVFILTSGLTLAPWLIKNGVETQSLHPTKLLLGAPSGPNLDIPTIDRNYQEFIDQNTGE